MATDTLTVTYREHDRYVVDAEVDGTNYRFYFDDPDVDEELLWILLEAEPRGIYPEARYAILDNVRSAIDTLLRASQPVEDDHEQRRILEIGALHTECGQLRCGISAAKSETRCWQYAFAGLCVVMACQTYWLGVILWK